MPTLTAASAADLFRSEPERFIDVGEGEVAYRRVGTGPDVLFVHGWPVSGATFRTLLPHLAEHVTCHIFDFPGAGSSRFDAATTLSLEQHVLTARRVLDALELNNVAVVGHDSGGLIARHAFAGDARVRSFGLIDTEQPQGLSWRFKSFLSMKHVPGVAPIFGRLFGAKRLRRNDFVLGKAFTDKDLINGEFDEFFLQPIHTIPARRDAAVRLLKGFDVGYIHRLADVHRRIDVPVTLVWGEDDAFFPVKWTREMVSGFPNATLHVIPGAGLFSHEERPAEVAAALLPGLLR